MKTKMRSVINLHPSFGGNIWVGDSHALFISGSPRATISSPSKHSDICVWLGPRLAYSIARHGLILPKTLNGIARIRKFERLVVAFGEIDCRMFLGSAQAARYRDETWVKRFVNEVLITGERNRVREVVFLTPVPPSDLSDDNPDFPKRGTLIDRINATEWLTKNIRLYANEHTMARVIVLRDLLAKKDGSLNPNFTDDGVHVNNIARLMIQEYVNESAFKPAL